MRLAWPEPDSVLRNREFLAFLSAMALTRMGSGSLTVMLGFHAFSLRNNPLDLAWLGLAQVIPSLTLSLHGGDAADRTDRRWLVTMATAFLALLCASMAFTALADGVTVPVLLVAGFLGGCLRAYHTPAAVGLEAQVIPIHQMLKGVPLLATASRVCDMLGPVLMGFLWAHSGPTAAYLAMGAAFAGASVLFRLGIARKPIPEVEGKLGPIARVTEGLRYVVGNQVLIGSMLLDLFAVFFGGTAALLPVFATEILDVGPDGFGLLRGAMAAGSLAAAVIAIRFMPRANAGTVFHLIVAGFGISMIMFGLSRSLALSMTLLFVAGMCDGYSVVVRQAILRLASPEAMRGRIAAVRMVFIGCSNELGAVQSGTMASLLGPVNAVVLGGTLTLGVVATVAATMPKLRGLNLLTYRTDETVTPVRAG